MERRGLNLIELVVAVAIAGTLVAFLMPLWPASARALQRARDSQVAMNVAARELETTMARGFDAMADRDGDATHETTARGVTRSVRYFYEVRVTPTPPDMKTVLVTVVWDDRGQVREVKLETIVTDPT